MMDVVFAAKAQRDVEEISQTIAKANPAAAQRVADAIFASCETLSQFPFASAATDEPGIRRVPMVRYPYAIFFRVDTQRNVVEIVHVIHGSRIGDLKRVPD